MEAANRGAADADGKSIGLNIERQVIGLNIGLRTSSVRTPSSRRELSFEFHYFFMRKLWFAHLRARSSSFRAASARSTS